MIKFYFILALSLLFIGCTDSRDKKVSKWVVVGNSITWHPVNDLWFGEYGMAASKPEKDYVHVLDNKIKGYNKDATYKIVWAVEWEKSPQNYDLSKIDSFFNGDEDLVIVRLGENVTDTTDYKNCFNRLITRIKKSSPNAQIIVSDIFMSASVFLKEKNKIQKEVSDMNGCTWVELNKLDKPSSRSKIGAMVVDTAYNQKYIENQTVADHPGDKGMYSIADKIFKAIKVNRTL